jgi:hypothetical protein
MSSSLFFKNNHNTLPETVRLSNRSTGLKPYASYTPMPQLVYYQPSFYQSTLVPSYFQNTLISSYNFLPIGLENHYGYDYYTRINLILIAILLLVSLDLIFVRPLKHHKLD